MRGIRDETDALVPPELLRKHDTFYPDFFGLTQEGEDIEDQTQDQAVLR